MSLGSRCFPVFFFFSINIYLFIIILFIWLLQHVRSSFLTRDGTQDPLHSKCRILAIGSPGKSLIFTWFVGQISRFLKWNKRTTAEPCVLNWMSTNLNENDAQELYLKVDEASEARMAISDLKVCEDVTEVVFVLDSQDGQERWRARMRPWVTPDEVCWPRRVCTQGGNYWGSREKWAGTGCVRLRISLSIQLSLETQWRLSSNTVA